MAILFLQEPTMNELPLSASLLIILPLRLLQGIFLAQGPIVYLLYSEAQIQLSHFLLDFSLVNQVNIP